MIRKMNHTKQEKRYKKKGSSKLHTHKENQFPITAAAVLLNKKAPRPTAPRQAQGTGTLTVSLACLRSFFKRNGAPSYSYLILCYSHCNWQTKY